MNDLFNIVCDDIIGWVCIQGIKNKKKPVWKMLPGIPRVGEALRYGRETWTGHGKYIVVAVEWSTADFA